MAKVLRALAHPFPAAPCPLARFQLESEAVGFARPHLFQTGLSVSVVPDDAGFLVISTGGR